MKVLSLFDGISCGMVALERAGIPVERYVAYEIEKNAINISKKNYPEVEHCGDVTTADFTQYQGIDLLIGGSPCQGFSIAGKQLNFSDPRSKLYFEFERALKEARPKYFLLENVKMKKEFADIITSRLGVEPIEINSNLVSAQNRKRIYWTNIPNVKAPEDLGIMLKDIVHETRKDSVDLEPYKVSFADTLKILDKEVEAGKIGYFRQDGQANRVYSIHGKAVTLCGEAGGGAAKMGQYLFGCLTPDRENKRQCGQRFNDGEKFYTLTAQDRHGVFIEGYIRKLTPMECERLQNLPDDYTAGIKDPQRYKCLGNGWTVNVIAHIFSYINLNEQKGDKKTMELKMQEVQFPKVIGFNFEELKQEITSKAELYKNMVYTDDTIKEAKADKATLNKFITALEDKRKEVKKQCLQPYEEFEKQIKELVAIVDEPVQLINEQVKAYEDKKKADKLEQIKEFWESTTHPDWLTCKAIFDQKWLNATTSMKKIHEAITERLEQVALDLNTLESLPEFAFEAVETYKNTLDVNKAIAEGQRLADIQKRKQEAEAAKAAEEERKAAEAEKQQAAQPDPQPEAKEENTPAQPAAEPQTEAAASWIRFEACMTVEQAMKLKQFFETENIRFRAI